MPAASSTQQPLVPTLVPQGAHAGQRPMTLNRLFTLIGSAPSARLYLPSKYVSRCHAVVINTDTGLFIRDLASRTQVLVNGRAVKEADLRDGDVVQIGPFTFRFSDGGAARDPKAAAKSIPRAGLRAEGLSEALPVEERAILIGRRESADISLTENSASSAHAVIVATEGTHILRDLNSRTGTFVNGVKIHEQVLSPGDVVRIGETTLRYVREAPAPAPPLKAAPGPAPAAKRPAPPPKDEVILDDPAELPVEPVAVAGSGIAQLSGGTRGVLDAVASERGGDVVDESADVGTTSPAVTLPHEPQPASAAEPDRSRLAAEDAKDADDHPPMDLTLDTLKVAGEPALAAPLPAVPSPAVPSPAVPSPAAPSTFEITALGFADPKSPSPDAPRPPEPAEARAETVAPAPPPAPRPPVAGAPPKRPAPASQGPGKAPPPPPLPAPSRGTSPAAPKAHPAPPPPPTPARTKSADVEGPGAKGARKGPPPPRPGRPRSPFDLVGRAADLDPLSDLLAEDRKPDADAAEGRQ